ncbi:MAG: VCBS repeat-containing protein, partial [Actinobacteria bacterium]|nr:VCBS repeat-containing protein [Actinomycetota bacterium]
RLGDVNGDGAPDFVTSAPNQVVGSVKQGQVYVFSGRTGALLRTINQPDAPQLSGDFGGNIIAPGDLNADGITDFVATSSGAFANSGAAYAFNGSTGALLYKVSNPDAVQKSRFGFGASEDGDVNGDGVGDYQVGAPLFAEGAVTNVGRSYTINGKTGAVLYTLQDPDVQQNARFGQSDADGPAPGDITGDGRPDIFVDGFLQNDGAFTAAGAAYLFNGATGAFIRPLRDPNPVASGSFAASNAPAGDIDRDGRPDLLVSSRGAIGRVTVFGGTNLTNVLTSFADPQAQNNALFGTGLAYPGDVNGDGQPDYFISSRSADVDGAVNVGIVWAFISRPPPVYPVPPVYPKPPSPFAGCPTSTSNQILGTAAADKITGTPA